MPVGFNFNYFSTLCHGAVLTENQSQSGQLQKDRENLATPSGIKANTGGCYKALKNVCVSELRLVRFLISYEFGARIFNPLSKSITKRSSAKPKKTRMTFDL